jgi:hypothetical protein
MKTHGNILLGNKFYPKGTEIPWYKVYPIFLAHMLVFGGSGFYLAYGTSRPPLLFLYLHGGFAITIYTALYLVIFGLDEVKWMFINASLGIIGIYSQIGWILSLFGKKIVDYPLYVHVVPFLYFVLYTFLIRHAVVDITQSRDNPTRRSIIDLLSALYERDIAPRARSVFLREICSILRTRLRSRR